MSSLLRHNPWWEAPEKINTDPEIQGFESSAMKWLPRIKYKIDLNSEAICTLRGPRQVGKTTLIKLMIRELLENRVDSHRIFYYACDLVENPSRLVEIIRSYLETVDHLSGMKYVFLDEISSVKDWQKGIKHLYDLGELRNTFVLLTGSHSLDIRRASERLPGRRGVSNTTLDKILLPMKFSEYVETRDREFNHILGLLGIRNLGKRREIIFNLVKGKIPQDLKRLSLYLDKLNQYLNEYLITGGIAKAVNDYYKSGEVMKSTYDTYVNVTIGDFLRHNKSERYLAQLIKAINEDLCSQVSWTDLAKKTDIGSHNTVSEYIEILKSGFVLRPYYVLDRSSGSPRYRSNKKIHYGDPFIFHALNGWVNQSPSFSLAQEYLGKHKSILVEGVVGDHLIRFAYNLNPSDNFEPTLNVFYWKDSKSEVDFILKTDQGYLPFEVKYASTFNSDQINGLYSFTSQDRENTGIVVTKDLLGIHHGVAAIPASMLLLVL